MTQSVIYTTCNTNGILIMSNGVLRSNPDMRVTLPELIMYVGKITWGHAVSKDLITWTDVDHSPEDDLAGWQNGQAVSFAPPTDASRAHERLGIWSGTALLTNIAGEDDGTILAFYTSVSTFLSSKN